MDKLAVKHPRGNTNRALENYLSNEKNPCRLGYIRDYTTQLLSYMGITINHEIRIPIQQPGFKVKKVFSWFTFRCEGKKPIFRSELAGEGGTPKVSHETRAKF